LEIGIFERVGQFELKFEVEEGVDRPVMPYTTLSLTVVTQRNFVADFLQVKCTFRWKTAILRF